MHLDSVFLHLFSSKANQLQHKLKLHILAHAMLYFNSTTSYCHCAKKYLGLSFEVV